MMNVLRQALTTVSTRKLQLYSCRCQRTLQRLLLSVVLMFVMTTLVLNSPPLLSTQIASVSQRQSPYPRQFKVVLLAYFRSGSTLASQLFNYNPSAIYWFEPLYSVTVPWKWYWPRGILPRNHFYHDNGSEIEMNDVKQRTLVAPLRHIFNCDLTKLDRRVTTSSFMRTAKLTSSYRDCRTGVFARSKPASSAAFVGDHHVTATKNDPTFNCLQKLTDSCRYSQLNVVKLIRMKMSLVENLLNSDPDVKVVHLVRDPRGILNSWWHQYKLTIQVLISAHNISTVITPPTWNLDAEILCLQMKNDVIEGQRLAAKYQDRVKTVRYEDLASNPINSTQLLYNFIYDDGAVDVPNEVWNAIKGMVNSNVQDGIYGTKRKDSVKTAYQWRNSMNSTVLREVTKICRPLLQLLEYEL